MTEKHTICWIDIPVENLERAIAFYSAVLNQKVQKISEHGLEFGLLPHVNDNVSGCLAVMEDRKPSKNGALIYLNVEGFLNEAVAAALKSDSTLLKPIESIGDYGFRAIITDSEGNAIALYSKSGK
ncbi:putative glyoxalase-like protein [Candidatus Fokinia solitaria]|uniref:Putative glyoxalase-like protein n=1 Tax=Candidatus Fokinia solitaria TaxID=1802984 RepID=A0A2U8BRK2_9RICK|nr:VOC family protein [Candidatus Fokinia solitaria]AWD32958.1 putative glyoxalase-like protein [Candidatus Fokinia solitaria]